MNMMKHTKLVILALAAAGFVGCDKQKAAIDENNESTKAAIDNRKEAVDVAAKDAKKQTDIDATIAKAKAEKARVDAEKK